MKLKKGDNVKVIAGKDRGKTGKVARAFPKLDMILVEGVNVHKKHLRAKKQGQKGQMVDRAFPIHVSNAKKV